MSVCVSVASDVCIFEFALEFGFLRMSPKTRRRLNITTHLILLGTTTTTTATTTITTTASTSTTAIFSECQLVLLAISFVELLFWSFLLSQ